MATVTLLSVNGRDGLDTAAGDRNRHLEPRATIPSLTGAAARNGVNAPTAVPGEPAGGLIVELWRSRVQEGGILVKVVKQRGSNALAAETEVLPNSKIHFSAIGGSGEDGRCGGPGENGQPGEKGQDASIEGDATFGGDGGTGGDGGQGSDGAHGGRGGLIQIVVDEDQTELLHAVSWDVSGGKGGAAGTHGQPGSGGAGGSGGSELVWQEFVQYKYKCTENCVGRRTDVALMANQYGNTDDLIRRLQAQTARTTRLTKAVSTAVSTVKGVSTGSDLSTSLCKCRPGGSGHCTGCEQMPIYNSRYRVAGRNGKDGVQGLTPKEPLLNGVSGEDGRVIIVVQRHSREVVEFGSAYQLQLVDFDVEDSNADGIFEPGENLFIRRIRVLNSGGMPSPKCAIPCTLTASGMLQTSDGEHSQADLAISIPEGQSLPSTSEIQAQLFYPNASSKKSIAWSFEQHISLAARMPWTGHTLEGFGRFSKKIYVQFPLTIDAVKAPLSLTPKTPSLITWKIQNKTKRPFGPFDGYRRIARVVVQVDPRHAELLGVDGAWMSSVELTAPIIKPQDMVDLQQAIRVKPKVQSHSQVTVSIHLYISAPGHIEKALHTPLAELQLVESRELQVQVAYEFQRSEDGDVLLVTNRTTSMSALLALRSFYEDELGLRTDTWNISVHGGLLKQRSEDSYEDVENIMADFAGKTVVCLGNDFVYCEEGSKSVLDFCDPLSLFGASRKHTSCLFFGMNNQNTHQSTMKMLLRPISQNIESLIQLLPDTARYTKQNQLVKSLQEADILCDQISLLAVPRSRIRKQAANLSEAAQGLSEDLARQVPQYHFMICKFPITEMNKERIDGYLIVLQGFSRRAHIEGDHGELIKLATPDSTLNLKSNSLQRRPTQIRREPAKLSMHDKLTLTSAISVAKRFELLQRGSLEAKNSELVILSLQTVIEEEIRSFLTASSKLTLSPDQEERLLRTCLPATYTLTGCVQLAGALTQDTQSVVAYCIASCQPQSKLSVGSHARLIFGDRRKQLLKFLKGRLGTAASKLDGESGPAKRCVADVLAERVNAVTGQPAHFQYRSRYGVTQSLQHNDILDVDGWNRAAKASRDAEEEVLRLYNLYLDEREKYGVTVTESPVAHEIP